MRSIHLFIAATSLDALVATLAELPNLTVIPTEAPDRWHVAADGIDADLTHNGIGTEPDGISPKRFPAVLASQIADADDARTAPWRSLAAAVRDAGLACALVLDLEWLGPTTGSQTSDQSAGNDRRP